MTENNQPSNIRILFVIIIILIGLYLLFLGGNALSSPHGSTLTDSKGFFPQAVKQYQETGSSSGSLWQAEDYVKHPEQWKSYVDDQGVTVYYKDWSLIDRVVQSVLVITGFAIIGLAVLFYQKGKKKEE